MIGEPAFWYGFLCAYGASIAAGLIIGALLYRHDV
jgi:hypothetical protein